MAVEPRCSTGALLPREQSRRRVCRFVLVKTNTFLKILQLRIGAREIERKKDFDCCEVWEGQHCVAGPSEEGSIGFRFCFGLNNLSYRLL